MVTKLWSKISLCLHNSKGELTSCLCRSQDWASALLQSTATLLSRELKAFQSQLRPSAQSKGQSSVLTSRTPLSSVKAGHRLTWICWTGTCFLTNLYFSQIEQNYCNLPRFPTSTMPEDSTGQAGKFFLSFTVLREPTPKSMMFTSSSFIVPPEREYIPPEIVYVFRVFYFKYLMYSKVHLIPEVCSQLVRFQYFTRPPDLLWTPMCNITQSNWSWLIHISTPYLAAIIPACPLQPLEQLSKILQISECLLWEVWQPVCIY